MAQNSSVAKKMPRAVLFWPDTEQVSTEDLDMVFVEDRYPGCPTTVKFGTTIHRAIVRLISSDPLKLKEMEDQVASEIDAAIEKRRAAQSNAPPSTSSGRRTLRASRASAPAAPGAATVNQVSSALGERFKPNAHQAQKAKELADAKKVANRAEREAQNDIDNVVMAEVSTNQNVQRQLFEDDEEVQDSGEDAEDLDFSADENENEGFSGENCCDHCRDLRKSYHQSGTLFLQALSKYANQTSGVGVCFAELLVIPEDVPKGEITKNSKVFISNFDRNSIKSDGDGDPAKMTRMALVALFGRSALESNAITARGFKSGTLGIRQNVRNAIRAFVNRNKGPGYKDLTDAVFNRVINRKKGQVHRAASRRSASKSPTSTKAGNSGKKSKKSPRKSKVSPVKKVPVERHQGTHNGNPSSRLSPAASANTDQAGRHEGMHQGNSNSQQCAIASTSRGGGSLNSSDFLSWVSIVPSPSPKKSQAMSNGVVHSPSKTRWTVQELNPMQTSSNSGGHSALGGYSSYGGFNASYSQHAGNTSCGVGPNHAGMVDNGGYFGWA